MSFLDFTTCDEVRAVLGVSAEELDDDVIGLPLYDRLLRQHFREVGTSAYATILSLTSSASLTEAEESLIDLAGVFATYALACELAKSMPNFSPRLISDGKANINRHDQAFRLVIAAVKNSLEDCRRKLSEAFTAYQGAAASPVLTYGGFVSVGLASDPVVGG